MTVSRGAHTGSSPARSTIFLRPDGTNVFSRPAARFFTYFKKSMDRFREILQHYWGYPDFRGIQADIIRSISQGHDTLGLMPTGGGKSITFQVPALAMEGMCLVITPLIALMKDQVENLRKRGIMAAAIYSGQTRDEMLRHLDNAVFGAYKFLYVSPERLTTDLFQGKLQRMKVCLLTVDEAHCISQWGYDFRPPYLKIAEVRKFLPGVPVLALTATATPDVVDDIQQRLAFRKPRVYRMSFARQNLRYVVRYTDDKLQQLVHILQCVPGSAIVYTRNRENTRQIADLLNKEGIRALHFHAGLTSLDKDTRQRAWQSDDTRVMVATNAFGMGIDKPDVRLVVHMDVPDSIEAYFQEAGRAGRDGHTAYAVLLCDRGDQGRLTRRIPETFPDRDYVRKVYDDLASFFQIAEGEGQGYTYELDTYKFCHYFHHNENYLHSALSLLTQAGYIQFRDEDEASSRLMFITTRDDLYRMDYLTPHEDAVLNAVLRIYGGVFADYVMVEEDRLAKLSALTVQQVYESLKQLTRRRVLNYVPGKKVPRVTYVTRRIDARWVEIPRSIYEDRKVLYERRIRSMVHYFTQGTQCRSRVLLHYFADEGDDCGHCDVCLERRRHPQPVDEADVRDLMERYLEVLHDGLPHDALHLPHADFPTEVHREALHRLVESEVVKADGGQVVLAH